MSRKIIHSVVLAALAGFSSLSLSQAQDLPAAVGRISSVQGQVTLVGSDEPVAAALNWPVTGASHLNTASGGRAEFRIGSTAVRVDGDSDLEITDLDDDLLRLRLNYGSVSIRIRSPEMLRDFELSTPQARITMIEPGVLRVDADRIADTSQISVMAGSARVDGAGSSVTVNSGRHVDVTNEDVRTSVATRDGFDVWAEERDRADQNAVVSTRFVSSGITGYEELDRNGTWNDNVEYGALWTPRNVAADWAPYRDGRWIWLAPWGWTWVDNAPWGYAPSHYGRWVMVGRRWSWAPGRPAGRPVWAPALVGWVGGEGPNHRGPGLGWFPLSPRERFVPNYRMSPDHERRMTWMHNGKPFNPSGPDRGDHRNGLTLLPRDQFEGRHVVQVGRNPQMIQAPNLVKNVTPVAPPQPAGPRVLETPRRGFVDRDHDGRPDRFERNDRNDRNDRFERNNGQPTRVLTAPSQPQPVPPQIPGRQQTTTTLAPGQFGTPNQPSQPLPNNVLIDVRPRFNPHGGQPQVGQGVNPAPPVQVAPQVNQPGNAQLPPPRERFDRNDRNDRNERGGDDRRRFRGQDDQRQQPAQQPQPQPQQIQQPRPQPQPQPQPQQVQQPRPQPQPQFQPPPRPAPQAQPQPQPQPAPQAQPAPHREPRQNEGRDRGDGRGDNRNRQNSQ
jgi:hypothetical protein